MANTYKIPMNKLVLAALLIFVVAVTTAVTWCFRSGFMWSAICLITVAGPLSALYWYMLYVNPKRAVITVADEGVLLLHLFPAQSSLGQPLKKLSRPISSPTRLSKSKKARK